MAKDARIGEWYQNDSGTRVVVVGISRGRLVVEHECGSVGLILDRDDWKHLPRCTGFYWTSQPEVFPQFYPPSFRSIDRAAFICRDSASCVVTVKKDGSETKWSTRWEEEYDGRKQITKADAFARLDDPGKYSESDPVDVHAAIAVLRSNVEKLAKRVAFLETTERRERSCAAG